MGSNGPKALRLGFDPKQKYGVVESNLKPIHSMP